VPASLNWQAAPLKPELHVQPPFPLMPCEQNPWLLHGVAAPPGHAWQDPPKYPGWHALHVPPVKFGGQLQLPSPLHDPLPLQVVGAKQKVQVG
jgi:hypothetical protein